MRRRLTKKAVDATRPNPKRDILVWDRDDPGFGLRVARGGTKSFVYQYTNADHKSRRLTLGRYGPLTVEGARDLLTLERAKVLRDEDPLQARKNRRGAVSVRTAAKEFLEERQGEVSPHTARLYELALRHLVEAIGDHRINAVPRLEIVRLRTKLRGTPIMANRVLVIASMLFTWAKIKWEGIGIENPCAGVKRFREKRRKRIVGIEHLPALGAKLREIGDTMPAAAFLAMLYTGARPSEVLAMKWADLDLDARLWRLEKAKTEPRTVYLSRQAVELIRRELSRKLAKPRKTPAARKSPLVFPGRVHRDEPRGQLSYLWYKQLAGAVPDGARLYDATRHLYASVAADLGVPEERRKVLVGHAPDGRDVHSRYAKNSPAVLLDDTDKICDALARALEGGE